jgi:4-amino-4-deoxy-L-arabinose transferase-like glycosyltransferase
VISAEEDKICLPVSRFDLGLIVIVVLPWIFICLGVNWVLDYVVGHEFLDPWFYFGFFLDLTARLKVFPATYYGSRLSWILPGYVVYRLFPTVIAPYVLHLGVYYSAVLSLYFTLKYTVSQRVALLSAVLMGGYGFFLWAVGWDYIDGAGLTYFLLTTLALSYAAREERSWIWLNVSGTLYGAMIYSQLFLVVVTPALLFYYFAAKREQRRHSLALSLLLFASGFIGISILLGLFNYKLDGEFLFYMPSVRAAMGLLGKPNLMRLPFHLWSNRATWLILPSLVFLSSIAFLCINWKRRTSPNVRFQVLFQCYFQICALIFVLFEAKGSPVLAYLYYASFLIPGTFLALGGQLAPLVDQLSSNHFVLAVCGAIVIPLLAYRVSPNSAATLWANSHAPTIVFVLAFIGVALFLVRGSAVRVLALSLPCLALGVVNAGSSYYRVSDSKISKLGFPAIVESVQAIRIMAPSGKLLFWYRDSEPMGNFYRSVASSYLWGFSLINERFPSLERKEDSFQFPSSNTEIAILSNEADALQQADLALDRIGLSVQLVDERSINKGEIGWKILLVKVQNRRSVEDVRLTSTAWPEGLYLDPQRQRFISFVSRQAHELFRSDMDDTSGWEVNRYSRSGGLTIQPSCLAVGDSCGLYSSGDPREHLASPFVSTNTAKPFVFFSVWVKPLKAAANPQVFLQNGHFVTVASSQQLSSREGGWVLEGGWLVGDDAQKLRLVVIQPPSSSSLLDKAILLETSGEASSIAGVQ